MKLVLASSPFKNKKIIKKAIDLTGKKKKEINVAVIIEAGYGEEVCLAKYTARGLNRILKNFGGTVCVLNLLAYAADEIMLRLEGVDIVFALGGSTDFLMKCFKKSGFDKLLPKLLETKVWVGSSAGSCILGMRTTEEEDRKIYPAEKYYDVNEWMNIVKAYIYPHFWSKYTNENADKLSIKASENYDMPIYLLSDKSAVIVEGEKQYLFGKKASKVFKGKILEKIK